MDVYNLTDGELRTELESHGVSVGPITVTTKKLYQKKLLGLLGGGGDADISIKPSLADSSLRSELLDDTFTSVSPLDTAVLVEDGKRMPGDESDHEESSRVLTPREVYDHRQRLSRGSFYNSADKHDTSAAQQQQPQDAASTRLVTFALLAMVLFCVVFLYFLNAEAMKEREHDEI